MTQSPIEKIRKLVGAVADDYDADIYLYSAPIDDEGYGKLLVEYAKLGESTKSRALLVLTTNGGLANSAYQIACFLQSQYKGFGDYPLDAGTQVC